MLDGEFGGRRSVGWTVAVLCSGEGGGVRVEAVVVAWYTPAGTAPVRLLVEAEASPTFLRRARV